MNNEPIVKVEHLSHRYSVQWAVRDINFEIDSTGIVGLLGSNGAGKSTIMNIICGVLSQTEGKVLIAGNDIRENPVAAKRNIGFLPQKPPLYNDLTVDEYLHYAARLRKMAPESIREAVESVKEKCGISHFSRRLIGNLSGGYQQRVGIAQAIIHNPRLVVMDEPTNGLDPNQTLEVRSLIAEIAADKAVLISTHILPEVQATCDRIMMIENGSIVFSGTIDEFDNYIEPDSFTMTLGHAPGEEEIMKVAGVTDVKLISDLTSTYRVWFDGDRETMARMVEESVKNGWKLTGIQIEKSSMNEVFAQLSGHGNHQ
ncbi:MAG: ABC transporter ATP-binding protein [Bacteroidetes bacterium]|uniref:ABC transporter ATP-binding protein n=1 Tax=Candidatus Cryptobacteroides merdigallinarum TaxID=2840770 RepID=A0A9D9HG60_9BACT|nr:ABC transporter ATP-binding protein [Candidatus Cryptobacteroides merdigallinarum]